jgi:hypothetical protein
MQDGQEARGDRAGTARRKGARPAGGDRRPEAKKLRVQYHLGEKLIERLGVHASLVHRSQSSVVEEILTSWLGRYGRGRELFPTVKEDSGPTQDVSAT